MASKISILCPTRGRPESVKRLLESIEATAAKIPEVILYIDDDDETMRDFVCRDFVYRGHVKKVVGPRITLSECWNECAKIAAGDILMHGGDDIIFESKRWDVQVRRAFGACDDRILFVHGDDGHWGDQFGTHGFIHRAWMETVGYFVPPYFSSDFNDTWLNEVANALGRRLFLPFLTEHMHPLWNKGVWDQTHKDRLARHAKDGVKELYQRLKPERDKDIKKLRAAIAGAGAANTKAEPELV
jgi:glycosyl transferase/beta-hydroxylase protein BlmF